MSAPKLSAVCSHRWLYEVLCGMRVFRIGARGKRLYRQQCATCGARREVSA